MLSIIVCTYNRCEILQECLDSVISKYTNQYPIELIVVDNNSTDYTSKIVHSLKEKHTWIKYSFEKKIGLSHARNNGYRLAGYDWVLYLDDDALVHNTFFERVNTLIIEQDFQFIGGLYLPWYKYGKPNWFKDKYASNKKSYKQITVLKKTEFVSGGVMLIKKTLLQTFGGFNSEFGMKGTEIRYGEEDYFQYKLRNSGIEIAYDPSLIIYHLVPKYKMNLRWHLKSSYKMGKTFLQVNGYPHNKLTGLTSLLIAIVQCIVHFFINLPKLLRREYYKENLILDLLKKPLKWFGVFISTWT